MPTIKNLPNLKIIQQEFRKLSDTKKAELLRGFFKTGPGQYGENDLFLGITVPRTREFAKKMQCSEKEINGLLHSPYHEERLLALIKLADKFKNGSPEERSKIFNYYLANTSYINNWDLVDLSSPQIIGAYLDGKPKDILFSLARSIDMWERRVAIVSTFYQIKQNSFEVTLKIAELLVNDPKDLIHKAVGWMLREAGKRDIAVLEKFLAVHYKTLPRTMLRYAIERFPEGRRQAYLKGLL